MLFGRVVGLVYHIDMAELIEHCSFITTKRFNKDLRRAREQGSSINGLIDVKNANNGSIFDYTVSIGAEYDYLVIHNAGIEQRIKLIDSELHFGTRIWFICDCGARVAKLYLPPIAREFKCRHCHLLSFQSSSVNKHSKHGAFIYKNSQILKIIGMRENMGRIFYNSRYTKRFKRWLVLCDKAGLTDERGSANDLMGGING